MRLWNLLFSHRVVGPPELLPEVRDLRAQLDTTQRMLRQFDAKLQVLSAMSTTPANQESDSNVPRTRPSSEH